LDPGEKRRIPLSCVGSLAGNRSSPGPNDLTSDGPQARLTAGCRAQSLFLSGRYRELDDFINTAGRSMGDLPDGDSTLAGIFQGLDHLFEYGSLDFLVLLGRTSDWRYEMPRSIELRPKLNGRFSTAAWSDAVSLKSCDGRF
jgi:hypothetical protein